MFVVAVVAVSVLLYLQFVGLETLCCWCFVPDPGFGSLWLLQVLGWSGFEEIVEGFEVVGNAEMR